MLTATEIIQRRQETNELYSLQPQTTIDGLKAMRELNETTTMGLRQAVAEYFQRDCPLGGC